MSEALFKKCREINFGRVGIDRAAGFYRELNEGIVRLCRSLPAAAQAGGMMFAMNYAGIKIGDGLDFFRNYPVPVWSDIYWIGQAAGIPGEISPDLMAQGITAHAMAMLLHSMDDHLADGQVPATHLALLLRSQAWLLMHRSLERFTEGLSGGVEEAELCIDRYYGGIISEASPADIDEYCRQFKDQMATGLIVPLATARRVSADTGLAEAARGACESFGIAWRLLDDIQDLGDDLSRGSRTAPYLLLSDEGKNLWACVSAAAGACDADDALRLLERKIGEERIIPRLLEMIRCELDSAASGAERAGLAGLAAEYRALAAPLPDGEKLS